MHAIQNVNQSSVSTIVRIHHVLKSIVSKAVDLQSEVVKKLKLLSLLNENIHMHVYVVI